MTPAGGVKLSIHGDSRSDRRVRFAEVTVKPDDGAELQLVTDAQGRFRYRLPEGEYEIRSAGGQARCTVRRHGWTNVHLALP